MTQQKVGSSPRRGPATQAPHWPRWMAPAGLGLILLTTILVYSPALNGGVLWDDDEHLIKPQLQSVEGLYRIWFEVGATQQYYPVLYTAFWIEQQLWNGAVLGYHVVTLLWHLLAVVLLYAILVRLKIPGALLAAAIFALHPVMVESVAWISEQKNTLAAVFCLGALLVYLKFDESRRRTYYFTALLLFVLGLLTKTPMTGTLPATLLVIFWWQRGTLSWQRDVRPLLPFFLLGVIGGLFTAWVEQEVLGAEGADFELTLLQRSLLAGRVIWFYLGKLLWPARLVFIYPRWEIDPHQWWQWVFPFATLATLVGLWIVRRKWRGPLAAWLIFVGTLVPVLGFLNVYPFKWSFVADHYQYMASLGIIVLVSAGIATGLERVSLPLRRTGVALCILLVGTLAILSSKQSRLYADAVTLWQATLERNPECWVAHNNLGTIMSSQGQPQEAIEHFRAALHIRPNYFAAHFNLGNALADTGQFPEAFAQFQQAIALQPNSVDANRGFGHALTNAGRHAEAIEKYQAALLLQPEDPQALNSLGAALTTVGRLPEAIQFLRRAVLLNPNHADVRVNLGNAYVQSGKSSEGIAELEKAVELAPQDAWAITNLGIGLWQAGRQTEAVEQFQRAVQLDPSAYAHNNLGAAEMKIGRLPEAIQQFQAAIARDAHFVQAYANLAEALKLSNRSQEAMAAAKKGIAIAKSLGDHTFIGQLEQCLTQLQTEPRGANDVQPPPESSQ